MFNFLKKTDLPKENLKYTAKLMYKDVSEVTWDKENLTKRNLDFSIESIRFIDQYAQNLMSTDRGKELLDQHFDGLANRIGAYLGEIIKNHIQQDFHWYEFKTIYLHSSKLDDSDSSMKKQSLLYSIKKDTVILPLFEVAQLLKGKSSYPNLLSYVEEMIQLNSFSK